MSVRRFIEGGVTADLRIGGVLGWWGMTREEAIERIQGSCQTISLEMMKIHPAVRALGDEAVQAVMLKAAHQLTVELEMIKKQAIKLQQRDDSTDL